MTVRRYIELIEQVTRGSLWHGTTILNLSAILTVDMIWSLGEGLSLTSDPVIAAARADDLTRHHASLVYPLEYKRSLDGLPRGAILEFDGQALRRAFDLVPVPDQDEEWRVRDSMRPIKSFLKAIYANEEDIRWCLDLVQDRQPYADDLVDLLSSPLLLPLDYPEAVE